MSAPWYDQNANASISIENRSYFTVSDMSIMQKIVSFSVTYNPELLATKFPDLDLFQTVVDGEWTLDRMLELGRSFAGDADGNGTMDYTDEWGLVSSQGDAIQFYLASGETLCAKDENDDPIISIGGARSLSVSQKILETLQQKDWVILYQDILAQGVPASEGSNTALRIFGDGRALFRISAFSAIKKLRAYDVEYAVVPMPAGRQYTDRVLYALQRSLCVWHRHPELALRRRRTLRCLHDGCAFRRRQGIHSHGVL